MFYMKHKGKKLPVRDDNVYTTCCECGKEIHVDLHDLLIGGQSDLYSTSITCHECCMKLGKIPGKKE